MDVNIQQIAEDLVLKAGFQNHVDVSTIESGGNNRVYRLDSERQAFLLKLYFCHELDLRDRLKSEFSFVSYCWDQGIRVVPEPLASDGYNHSALYEFIQGKRLRTDEIEQDHVVQSLDFFLGLNSFKKLEKAQKLPVASEACFAVRDHIACVDTRIKRLKEVKGIDTIDSEAAKFIQTRLAPTWKNVKDLVAKNVRLYDIGFAEVLRPGDRCLSPSDFGFHNAVREETNKLRFIDFEYAGWDDPAKTVCDFFCQPAVPVPMRYFDMFVEAVAGTFPEPEKLCHRIKILYPVYEIKWACIMLNVFHPIDTMRRKFALANISEEKHKTIQLEKARSALECLQETTI